MEVAMSPEMERLVHRKIEDGEYSSPVEVFDRALRLLDEYDRLRKLQDDDLKAAIAQGIEQAADGRFTDYDDNTLGDLITKVQTEGRARRVARRANS